MVIDMSRIKRLALFTGIILALALGSYYLLHGSGKPAQVDNKPDKLVTKSGNGSNLDRSESSFCSRYRMERERTRSKEISMLNQVIKEPDGGQARSDALHRLVKITADIENEMKMENLVRCHEVKDCVAIIQPDMTTLVISSKKMNDDQAAEIKSDLCKMMDYEEGQVTMVFQQ